MPPQSDPISFKDLFILLREGIRQQQIRLDEDYQERIAAFLLFLKEAQRHGYESLARELTPLALALNNTEIEIKFCFTRRLEEQFTLQVQPLDLGFKRRYAYAETVHSALHLKVERLTGHPQPHTTESSSI
jgi:hypothetical protein